MNYPEDARLECAYCAVVSPASEVECPACGAPMQEGFPVREIPDNSMEELIENSNQTLVTSGNRSAELAFSVSCFLGILIGGILMVIIFIAFTRIWTILAVIALILGLISILVSSLLSSRANTATIGGTYEREVEPEIDRYLATHNISRVEFNRKAAEILPSNAPLLFYLIE
jgi:hypothetical protein